MAYNETRITVSGIVTGKVTHTVVGTGFSRAVFRMHTRERRYDKELDDWVNGRDMFLAVTCWRELADNVHASLGHGDPVLVHGKLTIKDLAIDGGGSRQLVDVEASGVGPNLVACTARPFRSRDASAGPTIVAPRKEDELPSTLFDVPTAPSTEGELPLSNGPAPPREPAHPPATTPHDPETSKEVVEAPF